MAHIIPYFYHMTYTGETLTLFLLPTATLIILLTQQCCNLTINYSACSSFQHDRHSFIIMHLRVSCNPTWIKEQTETTKIAGIDFYLMSCTISLFFSEGTKKICTTAHIYNKDTFVSHTVIHFETVYQGITNLSHL